MGAVLLLGFGPTRGAYHPPGLTSGFGAVGDVLAAPAARWDAAWYLTIAHYGYLPELGPFTAARAAFFPLYPLLISLISDIGIVGALSGVIISMAALVAALYCLHRLTTLELAAPGSRLRGRRGAFAAERGGVDGRAAGGHASRRSGGAGARLVNPFADDRGTARLVVLLTAFAPMAFFLSADYSESLYLALSIGVLLQARRGRWLAAGVLGGLAAATRSTGVLLALPALILYLYGPREDDRGSRDGDAGPFADEGDWRARGGASGARRQAQTTGPAAATGPRRRLVAALAPRFQIRPDVLWLLLIPAGAIAYIGWFTLAGGEPLTPFHAQALWGRHFQGPIVGAFDGLKAAFEGARQLISGQSRHLYFPLEGHNPFVQAAHNITFFGFLLLAVPMTIGVLRRLPFAYGAYVLAALALPLSYPVATQPLMSLPRFLLVLFPLTIALGAWAAPHRRLTVALMVLSGAALVFFTGQFSTWHWVS